MLLSEIPEPVIKAYAFMFRSKFIWEKAKYDEWILIVVKKGMFQCKMAGKTYRVAENEMMFYPPHVSFERKVIEPLEIHYFWMDWNRQPQADEPLQLPAGKIEPLGKDRVKSTVSTMNQLCLNDNAEVVKLMSHLVKDLWYQYALENLRHHLKSTVHTSDALVLKALSCLQTNFHKKICLNEIAQSLHLSQVQFTRRFSHETGMSPVDYLTFLRVSHAKSLLIETDLSINSISERCGFDNQFYFSSRFKKHTGLSPSEYRKRYAV